MQVPPLNLFAIVAATLAALALAIVWYIPPAFGRRWATETKRYTGLTEVRLAANIPIKMGLWLLGFAINATVMAIVLGLVGAVNVPTAIGVALLCWAGFGLTISSWPPIHAGQPIAIWLMNGALFGLQQVAMAAILAVWR